jgi:hypothetical protein
MNWLLASRKSSAERTVMSIIYASDLALDCVSRKILINHLLALSDQLHCLN